MRKVAIAAGLVLIVAILAYVPDGRLSLYVSKALILEWAVILFIALLFLKNWWLKLFVVWCLIVTVGNYNKFSYITLNTILLMTVFYQILVDKLNKEAITQLLNTICVLALCQSLWMVLQYNGIWWLFIPKTGAETGNLHKLVGFLANTNHAGAFLGISLPAFCRGKWRWGLIPVGVTLLMSLSAGGMAAGVAGIATVVYFTRKKYLWVVLLIGVVMILKVDLRSVITGSGRYGAWRFIFTDYIPIKWLTGWGLGQFKVSFPLIYRTVQPAISENWTTAHNEFIHIWAETGIIGLGLMVGYLIHQIIKFFKTRKGLIAFAGVIAVIVSSNTIFLFHTTVGVVGITYLAMLEAATKAEGGHCVKPG